VASTTLTLAWPRRAASHSVETSGSVVMCYFPSMIVMPGLDPGIHDFLAHGTKDVDGRDIDGAKRRRSSNLYARP
jgi:hypothetical protein